MRRRRLFAATLAVALAMTGDAFAADADSDALPPDAPPLQALSTPNGWERAKDPMASHDWIVHVQVRRMMTEPLAGIDGDVFPDHGSSYRDAQYARALLALNDAFRRGSRDPLLRLDLGELLSLQERYKDAAEVLAHVLAEAPSVPGAHNAWLSLAFAYAHLDDPVNEAHAYETYLRDEEESRDRTVATLNLAEANMRLHRLPEAIEGYREVETTAGKDPSRTSVLAVWGLAIALDRLGDTRGAAEQAKLATTLDPEDRDRLVRPVIGDATTVFFVPPYERYWYLALGSTEDAKKADSARDAAFYWGRAVTLWKTYLAPAESIAHPEAWNSIAKAHLATAEKQLKLTTERARKEPKRPPSRYPLVR